MTYIILHTSAVHFTTLQIYEDDKSLYDNLKNVENLEHQKHRGKRS